MIKSLMTFALFLIVATSLAQYSLDTSSFQRISDSRMEEFLEDDDFAYVKAPSEAENTWLTAIRNFVARVINFLARTGAVGFIFKLLLYLIILIAFLLIILKLTDLSFRQVFYKSKKVPGQFQEAVGQHIEQMDFDRLIRASIRNQQYNLAVRYHFLKVLKELSEQGYINWQPFKNNTDYYTEISNEEIKMEFHRASRTFEYVWYGEFLISESLFAKISDQYGRLESKLTGK